MDREVVRGGYDRGGREYDGKNFRKSRSRAESREGGGGWRITVQGIFARVGRGEGIMPRCEHQDDLSGSKLGLTCVAGMCQSRKGRLIAEKPSSRPLP